MPKIAVVRSKVMERFFKDEQVIYEVLQCGHQYGIDGTEVRNIQRASTSGYRICKSCMAGVSVNGNTAPVPTKDLCIPCGRWVRLPHECMREWELEGT